MSPNDLDAYLRVTLKALRDHKVGAAVLNIPLAVGQEVRTFTLQASFMPELPEGGEVNPMPGGWKTGPNHLDNPDSLDPAALNGSTLP